MVSAEGGKGKDDMRQMPPGIRASIILHSHGYKSHWWISLLLDRTYFQRRGWCRLADGFKRLDCTLVEIPQDDRYRVEVARRFMQFLRLSSQA